MIGTVLQDSDGQFVGLTVGEDIAFAMENDCVPTAEMHERVARVAQMVDMETLQASSPYELSGGQKQRTSLAGVLIDDVDILLFDEPLANLDPATGKTAIEIIDDIHQQMQKDHPHHRTPPGGCAAPRGGPGDRDQRRAHHCGYERRTSWSAPMSW